MAYWNGSGKRLIYRLPSGAKPSLDGIAAETSMDSFTLPGGTMGSCSTLLIHHIMTKTNENGTADLRMDFGASEVIAAQIVAANNYLHRITAITNNNSTSSQVVTPLGNVIGIGSLGADATTASVDTSADVTIDTRGVVAASGDTLTLIDWWIELIA